MREAAGGREAARAAGRTVLKVQDSHYDRAVGSGAVLEAARRAADPKAVEVVAVGSDGAYELSPRVSIERPGGAIIRLDRVTPERAARAAAEPVSAAVSEADYGDFWTAQRRLLLGNTGEADPESLDAYLAGGGYTGLERALSMTPEEVIDEVLRAGLLGRGGAYFPAGRKWQSARAAPGGVRYVVVNAEEGEPGVYKDRHIMEGDPHLLIEGLLVAGYASGASKGYIYINAEARLSERRVRLAVEQARAAGLVGSDILGSAFEFEIEVRRGAGGYVCGEETTLLNTIEGQRRAPRLRPPFPTESGLFAMPTVINNVETLCNAAVVLTDGAEAYAEIGEGASGTKLISLSGAVRRPGLVEVPMGTTLRTIVYDIGGGARDGGRVAGVVAGGPSGGLLPEPMLDEPIQPGLMHPSGAVLGAGGIVVLDGSMPTLDIVRELASYNAAESCGKCTPCREGAPRMVEILDRMAPRGSAADAAELRELAHVVAAASLCGLGQMAGGPIVSALDLFAPDLLDEG